MATIQYRKKPTGNRKYHPEIPHNAVKCISGRCNYISGWFNAFLGGTITFPGGTITFLPRLWHFCPGISTSAPFCKKQA
ncbi:hypothetical protein [Draconibacterium orientale]|uniref:Uncharacterized protein n=1 Tax=Draconibacterium orientale TaxID=1168034 RepID=A0ABM5QCZ7_9BACT|nr:hypothetical protein [Draconibacterium orientale]AHW61630.1 hypothetical protein FH5T_05335 [Draconibacterium orientale]